jgi:hypothetical protein
MTLFYFRQVSAQAGGEIAGAQGARRALQGRAFAARGPAAARQQAQFARALTRADAISERLATLNFEQGIGSFRKLSHSVERSGRFLLSKTLFTI